jgi:hypothetical protein
MPGPGWIWGGLAGGTLVTLELHAVPGLYAPILETFTSRLARKRILIARFAASPCVRTCS